MAYKLHLNSKKKTMWGFGPEQVMDAIYWDREMGGGKKQVWGQTESRVLFYI